MLTIYCEAEITCDSPCCAAPLRERSGPAADITVVARTRTAARRELHDLARQGGWVAHGGYLGSTKWLCPWCESRRRLKIAAPVTITQKRTAMTPSQIALLRFAASAPKIISGGVSPDLRALINAGMMEAAPYEKAGLRGEGWQITEAGRVELIRVDAGAGA